MNHEINLNGLSVCIGIPTNRGLHALVVKSLFKTQSICMSRGIPCSLAMIEGNAVIEWARDEIAGLLLDSPANRFFLIDSDIVWEAEDFIKMLALSQIKEIICAAYRAKKDQPTFYIRYDDSTDLIADEYGLIDIMGTGLGFTVLRRGVLENVAARSKLLHDEISGKQYRSIFKIGSFMGNRRGEDMSFFESIKDLGYKIYLDPSIELGHIGTKVYRGKALDAMRIKDADSAT